jgi:hypothetical protein
MIVISQLGTFDVENYGDLLYPIVLRHLLQRRDASLSVRQYSLLPGNAPQEAGFETFPIRDLFESRQPGPLKLVVGGGDILRTDWYLVARHYGRNSRISSAGVRQSIGTAGLFGYFLRKKLSRQDAGSFFANRFRARWMNYPAAGPFLINAEDLPRGSTVSYVSCGAPHDFTTAENDRVKRTFDRAQFVYLRDEQSAERLWRAGVRREIRFAPDLTITLSDQFNQADEARRGREILSRLGVSVHRPVLCFQSKPYPSFREDEIVRQLQRYMERTNSDIVLLPTGYCHGDHEFLETLSKQSGGAFKYASVDSVFDVIAIIAASDVFVGTSLHGNITASSFGIPHLFGPLPVAKIEGFLSVMNLPPELKLHSWAEMNDRIDTAVGMGRDFFAGRAREGKAKVYKVVEELLQNLLK